MITIAQGFSFRLNSDGTQLVAGYQSCRRIDLASGVEEPWTRPGEWYPAGWSDGLPVVFTPTVASPPHTQAFRWDGVQLGADVEAVGHAGLAVIDGRRLSTNGSRIFHNGMDITPEAFLGVVWDDPWHYGYKSGADGGGPFVVRSLPDNLIVKEIDEGGMWERCYTTSIGVWVTGQYPGGSRAYTPAGHIALPAGELAGPVLERAGEFYVVTAVMGAQNNPRGVMVRPRVEFALGTLKGWYCDDIRHQQLQARVTPQGDILVAGVEFPGTGTITLELIPKDRPIGLVPPEPVIPDPPKPLPPPDPLHLDVSRHNGIAPLRIQATVANPIIGLPISWEKQIEDGPWLNVIVTDGPTHYFEFHQPGIFHVRAYVAGGVMVTNVETITVTELPKPEPPPPAPEWRPWVKVLIALSRWLTTRKPQS